MLRDPGSDQETSPWPHLPQCLDAHLRWIRAKESLTSVYCPLDPYSSRNSLRMNFAVSN